LEEAKINLKRLGDHDKAYNN